MGGLSATDQYRKKKKCTGKTRGADFGEFFTQPLLATTPASLRPLVSIISEINLFQRFGRPPPHAAAN
jgi:hypothetical protein